MCEINSNLSSDIRRILNLIKHSVGLNGTNSVYEVQIQTHSPSPDLWQKLL